MKQAASSPDQHLIDARNQPNSPHITIPPSEATVLTAVPLSLTHAHQRHLPPRPSPSHPLGHRRHRDHPKRQSLGGKVLWLLVILLLPVIGLILYYVLGRK
jgi:Phospholipase_D-nuclease N-terminal